MNCIRTILTYSNRCGAWDDRTIFDRILHAIPLPLMLVLFAINGLSIWLGRAAPYVELRAGAILFLGTVGVAVASVAALHALWNAPGRYAKLISGMSLMLIAVWIVLLHGGRLNELFGDLIFGNWTGPG